MVPRVGYLGENVPCLVVEVSYIEREKGRESKEKKRKEKKRKEKKRKEKKKRERKRIEREKKRKINLWEKRLTQKDLQLPLHLLNFISVLLFGLL